MVDALGVSFEERRVPLRLNYSKYGGLLTEDNLIRLAALLIDYSTVEPTLAVRNIVLENPEIKVRVSPVRAATEAFFFNAFASPGWVVVLLYRSLGNQRRNVRWLQRSRWGTLCRKRWRTAASASRAPTSPGDTSSARGLDFTNIFLPLLI